MWLTITGAIFDHFARLKRNSVIPAAFIGTIECVPVHFRILDWLYVCRQGYDNNSKFDYLIKEDEGQYPTWHIAKNPNYRAAENYVIIFFDVNTGEQIKTLNGLDPIAFSPDSSMLATGATGNQLVIWDIAFGEKLPLSLGLVPECWGKPYKKSLVFSPDGSMIAILSDKVILRDVSTGQRIKILENGLDPSFNWRGFSYGGTGALGEFSPNGTILASTWLLPTDLFWIGKGVILLWDVTSGQKTAMLEGHTKPITSLAFSPDGTLIASGAEDKTIIVWDAKNGSQLKVLQGHSGAINSLAFSPDGTLLYSGSLVLQRKVATGQAE